MSRYIATRAIRGANLIVKEADELLNKGLQERGPDTPVAFPNTAYYLPTILGMTGREVTKLGELVPVLEHAKDLLHPVPTAQCWTPYLGETLDSGMATLMAAEIIEAVRFVYGDEPGVLPGFHMAGGSFTSPEFTTGNGNGRLNGPIDDVQLRAWGIQLVDGQEQRGGGQDRA
jgi:acetyl-CoA synthase